MKKIIVLTSIISLVLLSGCNTFVSVDNNPSHSAEQTTAPSPDSSLPEFTVPGTTIEWELPIDVDDSFTEPVTEPVSEQGSTDVTTPVTTLGGDQTPTEEPTTPATEPTSVPAVEPTTSNQNNEQPTEPSVVDPTEPTTVPPTTVVQPTTKPSNSGPIELPLIPG